MRVISSSDTSAGWRAELVGRRIRERRQALGWNGEYLAYVLTDMGIRTSRMDVSRRERGVRKLTVDELFAYAIALDVGIADLLVDDDGDAWITPLRDTEIPFRKPRPGVPYFVERATAIALTGRELREWLGGGKLRAAIRRGDRSL